MDERKKELIAISFGLLLCGSVFINAAYQTYVNNQEQIIEFKVFEAYHQPGRSGTQILTWGVGKFFFLGNWTGQFYEDHTYRVTYVRQYGLKHSFIVIEWEEIT